MEYILEYKNWTEYDVLFNNRHSDIKVVDMQKVGTNMIYATNMDPNVAYTKNIRVSGYKEDYKGIAMFNIAKFGRIYLTPNPLEESEEYLDNSFYFSGGFQVKEEYQKMGFGKEIIKQLFVLVPELEHILLFAETNVGKPFWDKLGAEIVLTLNEEEYELLSPGLLKRMDVFSGDLSLLKLNRGFFV